MLSAARGRPQCRRCLRQTLRRLLCRQLCMCALLPQSALQPKLVRAQRYSAAVLVMSSAGSMAHTMDVLHGQVEA